MADNGHEAQITRTKSQYAITTECTCTPVPNIGNVYWINCPISKVAYQRQCCSRKRFLWTLEPHCQCDSWKPGCRTNSPSDQFQKPHIIFVGSFCMLWGSNTATDFDRTRHGIPTDVARFLMAVQSQWPFLTKVIIWFVIPVVSL